MTTPVPIGIRKHVRAMSLATAGAERLTASDLALLVERQSELLDVLVAGGSVTQVLDGLTRVVEELMPGSVCSVLLANPAEGTLHHGSAPNLPLEYIQAIDGLAIGPRAGSCGTAAHRRAAVMVEDIARDPLWVDFREIALPYGLRSCWSTPIMAGDELLGTFAIYKREPSTPQSQDLELIARITNLAAIAIEHDRWLGAVQAGRAAEMARAAAESASRAKSDFLAELSHELRTPLTSIVGYAELLGDLELPTARRKAALQAIIESGELIRSLVDELLDLARIERGVARVSLTAVAVDELVADAVVLLMPLAAARDIRIEAPSPRSRVTALADPLKLRQVLLNLLSNAVKYNRRGGGVTITVWAGEPDEVVISVRDTGIGISDPADGRLFEPFQRVVDDRPVDGASEGAGLGLAVSRRMVETMGGRIEVQSLVGRGSTFSVTLPAAPSP